jgi:hypothetical protein
MATAAAIHNATMLSRNIGGTLVQVLGNIFAIIGIKDADDRAYDIGEIVNNSIQGFIKGLIGAENYEQLTENWARANRIYQAAINVYQLLNDAFFGIAEGLETVGKYNARIGNALRKAGVVLENAYGWMSETFNFNTGKNRGIDALIENLQGAQEVASDLEDITGNFREARENIDEIGEQVGTIKAEVAAFEADKTEKETESKKISQSPAIPKEDLVKPN